MKAWIDFEFMEDGETIIPLSVGACRDDGGEYYAEFVADHSRANDWVRANVLPHLTGIQGPAALIADELKTFFGPTPELWGYYCDYDWVALCQMYGRMVDLPAGWPMYCLDVRQELWRIGDPDIPIAKPHAQHHAFEDAKWIRDVSRWVDQLRAGPFEDSAVDRRGHAVGMALGYYDRLAKTRMVLPKRDDCDLAVEIKPEVPELLATADAIDGYLATGIAPRAEGSR